MEKYRKKQIKIGLIYLLIAVIIVGGIYLIIKSKLPSCFDGVQNHGEDGIDCGGPCSLCSWQLQEDLEVISVEAIKTKDNYVDLVAKVKNPNQDFGAKLFSYKFNLYGFGNELIFSKQGTSYILPRETRYIIEQRISIDLKIFNTEFKVLDVTWQELEDYQEPELLIRHSYFEQSDNLSQAIGTLENRSNYDFDTIDVWAVLFDSNSRILGVGKSELKTILSGEDRYFEIKWFFSIDGQIDRVDMIAKANVFLDDNFMRRHSGERERFQDY